MSLQTKETDNQVLIDHFGAMRDEASNEGNKGRIIHCSRIMKILREAPPIKHADDLRGIKGVGAKSIAAIGEIIGFSSELKTSKKRKTAPMPSNVSGVEKDEDRKNKKSNVAVSAVQQPASLPSLLLAQSFEADKHDPKGWHLSEKLDGVRAYWDGQSSFWSRNGNPFNAPDWFKNDLPRVPLDGELFAGRGRFQETVSTVRTHVPNEDAWRSIRYLVFDSPDGGQKTFEQRLQFISTHISDDHPVAQIVDHEECRGHEHLEEALEKVISVGGEGLMLRKPLSLYEGKRSNTLLKVKRAYDAEAEVIGYYEGKGRNSDRCGALRCRMECGKEVKVGSGLTDEVRENPPSIGSIITYAFNELTKSGLPRFPRFIRERKDVSAPKDYVFERSK